MVLIINEKCSLCLLLLLFYDERFFLSFISSENFAFVFNKKVAILYALGVMENGK